MIGDLQSDITALQPVLEKTVKEVEEMIVHIDKDKHAASITQRQVSFMECVHVCIDLCVIYSVGCEQVEAEEQAAEVKAKQTQAIADDAQVWFAAKFLIVVSSSM